jgi:arylsulfatase A-like enzyme
VKKRRLVQVALGLLALFPAACSRRPERPNIVVIVVDALRADHLPFYGYPKNTAPFLNELSRHSSVFLHAYSTSSWTPPAVASLFTSLYPFQHHVNTGNPTAVNGDKTKKKFVVSAIPESITTMAEVLKNSGYRTFGLSSNLFVSEICGHKQGFDYFQKFRTKTDAEVLNAKLAKWRDELRKGPYHLYIHYTDLHLPYRRRGPWYQPQKNRRDDLISAYDSNIYYIDSKIRTLYNRMGWGRDTILIVTADHGEEFWEKGYRGHGYNLFNGSLRVPLLIFLPKGVRAGRRIEPNVTNIDILPTLCEYIRHRPEVQLEGRSLLLALQGKPEYLSGRPIYAYVDRGPNRWRAILRGEWKLIMTPEGDKYYLFNTKVDPGERTNLAENAPEEARKLEMAREYREFEKTSRKYEQKLVQLGSSSKQLEQLRSLGYIN